MFNEKKFSGPQPELQLLIRDLRTPLNREPGAESFFESSISLDCFNMGLGAIIELLQSVRPDMSLASGSTAGELLDWSAHHPHALVLLTESMLTEAAHNAAFNNALKQNRLVVVTRERGSVSPAQLAGLQPDAMVGQGCKLTDFLPLLTTYNLTDKGTSDAI